MKWAKPKVVACRTTCIRDAVPETVLWARGGEQATWQFDPTIRRSLQAREWPPPSGVKFCFLSCRLGAPSLNIYLSLFFVGRCQNRAAETALLDIIVPQLTFAFWSMKGGFREDVDYDHACRNEGQANDCWNV